MECCPSGHNSCASVKAGTYERTNITLSPSRKLILPSIEGGIPIHKFQMCWRGGNRGGAGPTRWAPTQTIMGSWYFFKSKKEIKLKEIWDFHQYKGYMSWFLYLTVSFSLVKSSLINYVEYGGIFYKSMLFTGRHQFLWLLLDRRIFWNALTTPGRMITFDSA